MEKDYAVNSATPVFCCTQRAQTVPSFMFLAFSIILRSICSTSSCLSCYSAACLSLRPSIGEMQGTEKQGRCQPDTLMLNNDLTSFSTLTLSIWFFYEASCNDGFYAVHLFFLYRFPSWHSLALRTHQKTTSKKMHVWHEFRWPWRRTSNHQHKQKAIIL